MRNYFIGIDAGTDSCGIAATDTEYNLLRFKGKDMWATSLFDEASPCDKRRTFRGARRRIKRRQQRIDLLQDIFSEKISETDNGFFIRLNNSSLLIDDKADAAKQKYTLFNDENFTDIEFYKKYPTIYHLRFALMNENKAEKSDIRLYYLALHHIIKYRGHFLFEGQTIEQIRNVKPVFKAINDFLSDNYEDCSVIFAEDKADELYDAVLNLDWSIKTGSKFIETLFGLSDKQGKEFAKAIAGGKFDTAVLFGNEEYKEKEINKYSFKNGTQESFEQFLSEYGDDAQLLQYLKSLYDWSIFIRMLKGKDSISEAMTAQYEKHHRDLRRLKDLVKKYMTQQEYDRFFRETNEKLKNYCAYSGINKINGQKQYVKRCSKEEFYAFIKSELNKYTNIMQDDDEYERILGEIEKGEYMPRILDADNGVFPYQLNEYELIKICNNLVKDYPEFADIKEDGFSAVEKIKKIFRFRIPYYVGPLSFNPDIESNAWIIKKSEERVLPWNFENVVNIDATAEKFIRRMTNKCSYLKGCDVIPKQSLLYSKFMVLNQLNKLTVNSVAISVDLKQKIFNELFLKDKRPTVKKLSKLLVSWGIVPKGEQVAYGGIDNDFTVNMSSYVTFDRIFGGEVEKYEKVIEDIILCHTLFNDKNDVENRILKNYSDISLVKENIKVIKGLSFKDFGALSKEFLVGLNAADEIGDGELPVTVMDLLWDTNMNLMEIINDPKYKFAEKIKVHNGEESSAVTYEDLDDYYLNAMAKRGVWRALVMIDEYVKAIGNPPQKFFIEVTRGEAKEKKRKDSRLASLKALYSANKNYIDEYNKLINELNKKTETDLRQEKLYLWFTQLGRCMYSGEKIDLDELSEDICDIDHIIPQSLKKDDSIHNNKVLVLKKYNKTKLDRYPLDPAWQAKNIKFWKILKEKHFITEEKYARLTRKEELTDDELNDFINRQLVVTGQETKAIAEILQRKYPDSKVVYSKSGNVSDFRQKFNLLKNRNVNDLHHARDAYLNIVVGNVFDTRFGIYNKTRSLYYVDENGVKKKYSLLRIYDRNIEGAWYKNVTEDKVRKVYNKNSMAVVRMSKEERGGFYDQTIYRKGEGIIPIKQTGALSDTSKYGGYKSSGTAYFMVVDSLDKKGGKIRTIEAMTIYHAMLIKTNQLTMDEYLSKILGLKEPKIVFEKIKNKSLISWNGTLVYLSGMTGNRVLLHNANQWFIDNDSSDYLRIVFKALEETSRFEKIEDDDTILVIKSKIEENNKYIGKNENRKIYDLIINQLEKNLYKGIGTFDLIKNYMLKGEETFEQLKILEQCKVLKELIGFLQCKGFSADLTAIGASKSSGTIKCNKTITETDIALINRSPAGLYENVVVINKTNR